MRDVFERFVHVRETRGEHELILEIRVSWQFEAFHFARDRIDLVTFLNIQQRDTRAITGGVAHRIYILQCAIGDQPDQHRFFLVNITAEAASQNNFIRRLQTAPF